ncbi:TIM-barrel domain-containing protein [Nocardioides cheoyonin]|uniref:TIM-barrel domain-containing protein n=1 Tax=Nocardioides cheoyonin TaxID=3156615 RepID=UPI0032B5F652
MNIRRTLAPLASLACGLALTLAATHAASADPVGTTSGPERSGTVTDGHARFEVLTPTLIRMEYAGDDAFTDAGTFNVQDRSFPTPAYTTSVEDGYRVIRTSALTLRYLEGSGPFTDANTSVDLRVAGQPVTAHPVWTNAPCVAGQWCQAEAGTLTGGAGTATDHTGYQGSSFVALSRAGAAVDWSLIGSQEGDVVVRIRYANSYGAIGGGTKTLSLAVDDGTPQTVSLPMTASWDDWGTVDVPLHLAAGDHHVVLSCGTGDSCNVNVDAMTVTAPDAALPADPAPVAHHQLGGWYRDLGGKTGAVPLNPGLLSRDGWYLLDDTTTPTWTGGTDTPVARTQHAGGYQDGYFFGYGHDYKSALSELNHLTGPADLLPRWAFGVWFSRYWPYTTQDYEQTLLPAFREHKVPLDVLAVDTDFKSPNTWNGWNWNSKLFPDPKAFLTWAHSQNLKVTTNIHAGIQDDDPRFADAEEAAGGSLINNGSGHWWEPSSTEYTWDWSDPKQVASYFSLHKPFEDDGVDFWWLDYFGQGESGVSTPGLSPDAWINNLYDQRREAKGERGFSFARMGGQWGERRTTVAFTGDTNATWDMLKFESEFTAAEGASLGLPYVTHDIGSFLGKHLSADLYVRWVQLGAFQPVMRLHSDHGDRLPWDYSDAAGEAATKFLRLREALVPYSYTLAEEATRTGVPMTRPLYLDYPEEDAAYEHNSEYLYGDDVLVAPVSTPGRTATTDVWLPPGTWTDYFTGRTYAGGASYSITTSWDEMPVFVQGGGILPTRAKYVDNDASDPGTSLALDVYPQGRSSFSLYEDAGDGQEYRSGAHASTTVSVTAPQRGRGQVDVTIGARRGTYAGAPTARSYTVALHTDTEPAQVFLGNRKLPHVATLDDAPGWTYDDGVVRVSTGRVSTRTATTVRAVATSAVGGAHAEDEADLALDVPPVATPGGTVDVSATVTNTTEQRLSGVATTLTGPSGWSIEPADAGGSSALAPGASLTSTFHVTPPGDAQPDSYVLRARTSYVARGTSHTVSAVGSLAVADSDVAAYFDSIAITDDSNLAPGDFDGYGDSYSAQALAAAGFTPGGDLSADGLTYHVPDTARGEPDNVIAAGQTLAVPDGASAYGLLASATGTRPTGTVVVTYADGSTDNVPISVDNWTLSGGQQQAVNPIAVRTPYRNCPNCGGRQNTATYLYSVRVPLDPDKQAITVSLPGDATGGEIHVFAVGSS